jgi:hypothetical protein
VPSTELPSRRWLLTISRVSETISSSRRRGALIGGAVDYVRIASNLSLRRAASGRDDGRLRELLTDLQTAAKAAQKKTGAIRARCVCAAKR